MNGSSATPTDPLSAPTNAPISALEIESFVCGPLQTNSYLLFDAGAREAVIIDPSIQSDAVFARARQLQRDGITLTAIWNTHGHFDHIYDNAKWKSAFNAPILAHEGDAFFLENLPSQSIWFGLPAPEIAPIDQSINEGDTLRVGTFSCRVLFLPGHSPGSVAFYFEAQGVCISGDVLFAGSVGRTDLPGSSEADLAASLRQLFALPPQTQILSGHGEATTLQNESRGNALARQLMARD